MAPVAHGLAARGGRPTLVLTGQHPHLRPEDYGLGGYPLVRLGCQGQPNPHAHVRSVTQALLPHLRDGPDLLVVHGDTSSAMGSALAGSQAAIPVAHVEAGLRTHDPRLPWPEEEYRVAIDARADLLFAPTVSAAANLGLEQISGEVHVTGNTGIDALLAVEAALPPPSLHDSGVPKLLVTCHRRESWGAGLECIASSLIALAADGSASIDLILHPNPEVSGLLRRKLEGRTGIAMIGPSSHPELVRRIRDSDLVLSDSGGIQEEASTMGTPLLILREKTERPEAIASGNARLVGTSPDRIVSETRRLLADPVERGSMMGRTFPFGDGRAGPRIAAIIEQWLAEHRCDRNQRSARN